MRLRACPFSAGSVWISPRASKAARTPVGDSTALRIMLATFLSWDAPTEIGGHLDREPLRLARRGVDEMDVPGLLVDDRVRTRRRAHDVEVVVPRQLRNLFGARVIAEEIGGAAAVGEEVRLSPTHMGEVSLLSTHGSFSTEWSLRSIRRMGCVRPPR